MKQLPLAARLYVSSVILAGLAILYLRVPAIEFDEPWLLLALVALSSASATMTIALPVTAHVSTLSVSYAVDFASLLLLGTDQTLIVAAAGAVGQCVLSQRGHTPVHRALFSMAALVVTVACAGLAFALVAPPQADAVTAMARPLVTAAAAYFLVHTGLTAGAIALTSGKPLLDTWRTNFLWTAPSYIVGAGTAALAVTVMQRVGVWLVPLTFAPIYLTYRTYRVYLGRIEAQRHVQETADLHLATIEALAAAIDAKDRMTRVHIRRVQAYAAALADAVGLAAEAIQAVRMAALLHDIGKLAIPAHILSKPGPLTPEEFAKVSIHPQIGAEIIATVPFPYPVAPIVLSHHERWDGAGYPQGLKGKAIPIGARILSVVDAYDLATSGRTFQTALPEDSALALLKHEAGRALDPALVDTFIDLLPALQRRDSVEPGVQAVPGVRGAGDGDQPPDAFENIALAHQEIYALYEIAQTMGTSLSVSDTMALISAKLAAIIPWSGCALFLQEADGAFVRCRFATGLDSPLLLDTRIRTGEGLSGWVARHRRTLVNASPRIEFEAAGIGTPASTGSAIVCPLESGERFIGSLALFHTEANRYTDDHRRLLGRVAQQAAAVLNNSIVFEQTQEQSLTDALTRLPNRRSLLSRLDEEISRAERAKTPLAVIVMDVDGFKQINDTHGHATGDHVLQAIAASLLDGLRPYDLCVRYAGDEFVAVLSGCDADDAEVRLRDLQVRVESVIVSAGDERLDIGVSAGAAVYPQDGLTHEQLLAHADMRMYRDKAQRRRPAHLPLAAPAAWDRPVHAAAMSTRQPG